MSTRPRQLVLDLRAPPRWGGRRTGAGRKTGPIPRAPHRRRPSLAGRFPCHVTLKVRREIPSLRSARLVRELERSFSVACERGRFRVAQYSIQSDHLHAIVEAASSADLAAGMKSIAARLARAAKVGLILLRRPARIDPASSGRWFDGWAAPAPVPGPDLPAIAPPRSWLLRLGWRRHGLLRSDEVPGRPHGAQSTKRVARALARPPSSRHNECLRARGSDGRFPAANS